MDVMTICLLRAATAPSEAPSIRNPFAMQLWKCADRVRATPLGGVLHWQERPQGTISSTCHIRSSICVLWQPSVALLICGTHWPGHGSSWSSEKMRLSMLPVQPDNRPASSRSAQMIHICVLFLTPALVTKSRNMKLRMRVQSRGSPCLIRAPRRTRVLALSRPLRQWR